MAIEKARLEFFLDPRLPPAPATGAAAPINAADAEPPSQPAPYVGIAQFFTEADARTHRRDNRAYEAIKVLGKGQQPSASGYELVIEGRLGPVWSWVHPRIRAEGVSFANADWGKADYLLSAEAIEASISVFPLLAGRVVLPEGWLDDTDGSGCALREDSSEMSGG